jgi:ribonuclease III
MPYLIDGSSFFGYTPALPPFRAAGEMGVTEENDFAGGIEYRAGYRFRNRAILAEALTHRSYVNESPAGTADNERLEFLGDAVLGFVVSSLLMERYPRLREGELSRLRASLVGEVALSRISVEVGLGDALILGKGEEKTGGRSRPSILAGVFEAVVAALYLDGGIDVAARFIRQIFEPLVEETGSRLSRDRKTELQELVQATTGTVPRYAVTDVTGPEHEPQYTVSVSVDGELVASGVGRNRKAAEQEAAKDALERLRRQP